MNYAAPRTRVPLFAPVALPGSGSGLAAAVEAQAGSYTISFYFASRPTSVNSPSINRSAANYYGGFGAQAYPSAPDARAALAGTAYPPCPGSTQSAVALGAGITGTRYASSACGDLINWTEGSWRLQAQAQSSPQAGRAASQLVAYFHTHFLPPGPGEFSVALGASSGRSEASWVDASAPDVLLSATGPGTLSLQLAERTVSTASYRG